MPAIMRAMPYLEGRELRISAPLPNNTRGRDVAESMKGPLPLYGGLSVEFRAERQTRQGGIRTYQQSAPVWRCPGAEGRLRRRPG